MLVSSHLLAEVEQICSHVGVMRTGRLVFQGTLDELRARGAARIQVRTSEAQRAAEVLGKLGLADVQAADGEVTAALGGPGSRRTSAVSWSTPTSRWPGWTRPGPAWKTCSSG